MKILPPPSRAPTAPSAVRARPVSRTAWLSCLVFAATLSGCDLLGIEGASAVTARKESDGKAIGAGCRHAGRAIEDCFALNKKADRAAVFAGWREMNDYMRENNIEAVKPVLAGTGVAAKALNPEIDVEKVEKPDDKPAKGERSRSGG